MFFKTLTLALLALFSVEVFASGNVVIDGKKVKTREEMQVLLEKHLQLPQNHGKNLDTLYSALAADSRAENIIRLKHLDILRRKMGEQYVEDFIEVVGRASEDNARVVLILE